MAWCLTALILLSCAGCVVAPSDSDLTTVTVAPVVATASPVPAYSGVALPAAPSISDVSAAFDALVAAYTEVEPLGFLHDDTLLYRLSAPSSNLLVGFDPYTGTFSAQYALPSAGGEDNWAQAPTVLPLQSGNVAVCDVLQNALILLDDHLNEVTRYPDLLPEVQRKAAMAGETYLKFAYAERRNVVYFCGSYTEPVLYTHDLTTGALCTFFSVEGDENKHLSALSLTDDGSCLNVQVSDYSFPQAADGSPAREQYVLDAQSGAVRDRSWLNLTQYADGASTALCRYYHAVSSLTVNDVPIDVQYLEEYAHLSLCLEKNVAVTVAAITEETYSALLFSAYDLQTGALTARTSYVLEENLFFVEGCDVCSGTRDVFCLSYSGWNADDAMQTSRLLWRYDEAAIDPLPAALEQRLTPCPNRSVPDDLSAYAQQIGDKYGVDILYGAAMTAYLSEHDLGSVTVTTFADFADPAYLFECLHLLDEGLSIYPDGMLEALGRLDDGKLILLLCTHIADTMVDFSVGGEYISFGTGQFVALNFPLNDAGDFDYGSDSAKYRSILHHELCHAFQRYIFMEGTLYEYDTWASALPADFYYGLEDVTPYLPPSAPDDVYFVDEYSTHSILEDMSRLFEYAMFPDRPAVLYDAHVLVRYNYLCDLLRNAFDDGAWPDVMPWEPDAATPQPK